MDGDGACDAEEPNTKDDPSKITLDPPGGDPEVTVELLPNGCVQILDFAFLEEIDLSPEDEYFEYPFGIVTFSLPCASAEVKITFEQATTDLSSNFVYRVYNPTTMEYSTLTEGVTLMGNMAILSLTDGGPGDMGTVEAATSGSAVIEHTGGPAYSIGPVGAPAMSFGGLVIAVGIFFGIGYRRRWL